MNRVLPLMFAISMWAADFYLDSKTEVELRRELAASQDANAALRRELAATNAKLKQQLEVARVIPHELQKKVQTLVEAHANDKNALEQTQAQTTQTLINTDASIQAQIEFEKQLTVVVRSQARSDGNMAKLLYLNLATLLLVLCFLGVILYYPALIIRKQNQQTGAELHGGS